MRTTDEATDQAVEDMRAAVAALEAIQASPLLIEAEQRAAKRFSRLLEAVIPPWYDTGKED
jgi:hypothetical protein